MLKIHHQALLAKNFLKTQVPSCFTRVSFSSFLPGEFIHNKFSKGGLVVKFVHTNLLLSISSDSFHKQLCKIVRGPWVLDVDSYEFHIEEVYFPVKHDIYCDI